MTGIDTSTHLFLDRRLIAHCDNVETCIAACTKQPVNPLPVDGRTIWTRNNLMVSVYRDPESGRYFGWRYENQPCVGAADHGVAFPIASEDGLSWRTIGNSIRMGAIMPDPIDADPERRFKMVFGAWAEIGKDGCIQRILTKKEWAMEGGERNQALKRGIFAATSPHAQSWPEIHPVVIENIAPGFRWWTPGSPGWAGGDSFPCLLWAPTLGKYVAFFRTNIERGEGKRRERAVGRADSSDCRAWSAHSFALHARTTWCKAMGYGPQDYYQLQVWFCGGIYLGILSVFYWEEDRVHLELAWSPDTVNWERVCPGEDIIPHGDLGEHDGGCRFAAMRPITVGKECRVYYGGDNGRHNADPGRESTFNLAVFKRDRFAGLRAKGMTAGKVSLKPIELRGKHILLNASVTRGTIRVQVNNEQGHPIPGFDAESCVPNDSDALDAPVRWRTCDNLASLRGSKLQFSFFLAGDATLYAFRTGDIDISQAASRGQA